MPNAATAKPPITASKVADWVDAAGEFVERHLQQFIALDTETDSLDPLRARIVGISLAVEPGRAAYIPLAHDYPGAPTQLPLQDVLARLADGSEPWPDLAVIDVRMAGLDGFFMSRLQRRDGA